MKRLDFIILLSCVLFSSCIVEKHNKPPRTQKARDIVYESSSSFIRGVQSLDIALKADAWLSAPSEKEKNAIEDLYFSNFKLRMSGDTIVIVNLCKIKTFGKSLRQPDSKWKFTSDTIHVSRTSEDVYGVSASNKLYSIDLTVAPIYYGYKVSGSGSYLLSARGSVKYKIEKDIIIDGIKGSNYWLDTHSFYRYIIGGINKLQWYRTHDLSIAPEDITVEYTSDYRLIISAFGAKDVYNIDYYSYQIR